MDNEQNQISQTGSQIQGNQQSASVQVDSPVNTDVNTQPTEVDSELSKIAEELGLSPDDKVLREYFDKNIKKEEKPKEQVAEKIKVGDKEYTKEEIEAIKAFNNAKPEPKLDTPQEPFRPAEEIARDYNNNKESSVKDYASLFTRYINSSNPVITQDEAGNRQASYDEAKLAIVQGFKTGDYSQFVKYLSPEIIPTFIEDVNKIASDYKAKEAKLVDEYKLHQEHNNSKLWDSYINDNAKDEQEKFILSEIRKENPDGVAKNKESIDKLVKLFNAARAMQINNKIMKQQENDVKKAMMSTNTSTPQPPQTKDFTAEQLKNMDAATFMKLDSEGAFKKYI